MRASHEVLALALVLATLAGVPALIALAEAHYARVADAPPEAQVVTLTGVSAGGIWTDEEVSGHSYWRRTPRRARPTFQAGRPVVIRLKSADVTHSFAIPELDVGPVTVEPGHVSEARFTPQEPGEYLTQCATRCGDCHEEMLGTIVVLGPGQTLADYAEPVLPPRSKCHLDVGE